MYRAYFFVKAKVLEPTQLTTKSFLSALAKGDTATASNYTTGDLSSEKLQSLATQIQQYGEFKNISIGGFSADKSGGNAMHAHITGAATFANTNKNFNATLVGSLDGGFKIEDFKFD